MILFNVLLVVSVIFIFPFGTDRVIRATFFRIVLIVSAEFILLNFAHRLYSVSKALFPPILPSIFTLFLKRRLLQDSNERYHSDSLQAYQENDCDHGI